MGHHDQNIGRSKYTQSTILYSAVNIYNKLPKNLTLIKSHNIFKKWTKRYNLNNKTKLREQNDNIENNTFLTSNQQTLDDCFNIYNS